MLYFNDEYHLRTIDISKLKDLYIAS